jgi:chloramphenicol 3-O-phosphotransferase
MEIKPRFNNRSVRKLQEEHGIDLFKLGDALNSVDARCKIILAGHPAADPADVLNACDELTPGEFMEILTDALMRDLIPQSQREAAAKAAAPDKSEAA